MPENFHFLNPQWLYLLLPLAIALWLLAKHTGNGQDAWQKLIDSELLHWLQVSRGGSRKYFPLWLLGAGWFIAVIALANPVWEKLPQPVFQTDQARVIVLDLSRSMNSSDLKPSRIERARFKVSDILERQQEGVIGLVVFAGDAFVVSPLTRDGDTISAMLPALKPGIMPVQGSRADLGLQKAAELLQQAGRVRGEILLLADSYTDKRTIDVAENLRKKGYITSVLGAGTGQGAPLPNGQGGFIRNNDGAVITTRLDVNEMKKLATAGGGVYVNLSAGDEDISRLLEPRIESSRTLTADGESFEATRWKETGPWLAILLLPLAALAFRRGWLLSALLLVMLVIPDEQAMAFSMDDLWQRPDQQAHKALLDGKLERAIELSRDPLRKGTAEFRKGDYEAAVKDFSAADSAEAAYNKGNALAKLGKLQDAIDAYEQALKVKPQMEDARFNKEAVEKLLQQQKDQQKKQNQQGSEEKNQQGESQQDKNSQQGQEGQQNRQGESSAGGDEQEAENKSGSSQQADKQAGSANKADGNENAFSEAASQIEKEAKKENEADKENADKQGKSAAEQQEKGDSKMAAEKGDLSNQNNADAGQQQGRAASDAEELTSEEQIAAEQWLRRIPDDPAGLLRRKLRYQYIQRGGNTGSPADPQPW